MNNLRDRGQTDDADFLARVDLLAAAGMLVLVSDLGAFHDLAEYLAARSVRRTGLVLGMPLLRELFNEAHYRGLAGGILEAFGRLFTHGVRLYVQPTRDTIDGGVVTADTLRVAPHLAPLLEHLRANGLIRPLPCDPAWRELVVPEVAALIEARGYFGGGRGGQP